ncbi:MAG: hypothetical protein AAGJ35_13235, partial [Myxococcota bacterium]
MALYDRMLREQIQELIEQWESLTEWDRSWGVARGLFLLQPLIHEEQVLWQEELKQLHLWQVQMESLLLPEHREDRRVESTSVLEELQKHFVVLVGDTGRERVDALHEMVFLQRELSALQWWLEGCPQLEQTWQAEAIADLSWLEREVEVFLQVFGDDEQRSLMDRRIGISEVTQQASIQLSGVLRTRLFQQTEPLQAMIARIREEILLYETQMFLRAYEAEKERRDEDQDGVEERQREEV